MNKHRIRVAAITVALCVALGSPAAAGEGADWPQFRGVHRDGTSPETGLAASWPEAGRYSSTSCPIRGISTLRRRAVLLRRAPVL